MGFPIQPLMTSVGRVFHANVHWDSRRFPDAEH